MFGGQGFLFSSGVRSDGNSGDDIGDGSDGDGPVPLSLQPARTRVM
jgi:hypothetical protein